MQEPSYCQKFFNSWREGRSTFVNPYNGRTHEKVGSTAKALIAICGNPSLPGAVPIRDGNPIKMKPYQQVGEYFTEYGNAAISKGGLPQHLETAATEYFGPQTVKTLTGEVGAPPVPVSISRGIRPPASIL